MTTGAERSLEYRPEIDGLRAIAVLAVVLYHADIGPAAGFVGVDIFFVISGYLITALLRREWLQSKRIDFAAFYARRIRRIFPALTLVILATLLGSTIWLSPYGEQLVVSRSASASILFVGNIYFQNASGGYFDVDAGRLPLLHLWSLGVEEQFYILWPFLFMAAMRIKEARLPTAMFILCLLSLISAEVLLYVDASSAFYQMPARLWELAAGALVAVRFKKISVAHSKWQTYAGVVLVAIAIFVPLPHFPGTGALPAVLGTMLLIGAVHCSRDIGAVGRMLGSRPLVSIGLISYSLYLWHWPLLAMDRATRVGPAPLSIRVLLVAIALLLSWLSFRWIEQPFRRRSAAPDSRLVLSAVLFSVSLAVCIYHVSNVLDRPPPLTDLASVTAQDMPRNRDQCNFRGDQSLDIFPRPGCESAPGKPLRVVIWGDSHALAWQPLAWALADEGGVSATSYTRDACGPLLDYENGKRQLEAQRCREFNAKVLSHLDGVDTLIMAAYWPTDTGERDFRTQLERTFLQVAPLVRRIIVLGPTPTLRDNAALCIKAARLDDCAVSRTQFDARSGESRKMLLSIIAKYPSVQYVELADFFCNATDCPVLRDGYSLYWDNNHVSSTAAARFAQIWLAGQGKSPH